MSIHSCKDKEKHILDGTWIVSWITLFLSNFIFLLRETSESWLKPGITRECLILDFNWRGWALPPPKTNSQMVSSTGEDWVLVGWLDNGPCMFWIKPLMWHRVQGLSSWGRWDLLQPCKGLWLSFSCFQWVRLKGLQVQAGVGCCLLGAEHEIVHHLQDLKIFCLQPLFSLIENTSWPNNCNENTYWVPQKTP